MMNAKIKFKNNSNKVKSIVSDNNKKKGKNISKKTKGNSKKIVDLKKYDLNKDLMCIKLFLNLSYNKTNRDINYMKIFNLIKKKYKSFVTKNKKVNLDKIKKKIKVNRNSIN